MKFWTYLTVTLLCTCSLYAQDDKAKKEKGNDRRGDWRERMIKQFDKDGDGKLNEAERQEARKNWRKRGEERRQQFMKKYDKNGDGKIDDAEGEQIAQDMLKRFKEHAPDRYKERYDKNNDGKVDAEEEKQAIARMMEMGKRWRDGGGDRGRDRGRNRRGGDADGADMPDRFQGVL